MTNLLIAIWHQLKAAAQAHSELLITIGIIAFIIGTIVYISTPRIARFFIRTVKRQPKELQHELISLVSNSKIVEFYEPSNQYIEDVKEGEKRPLTNAWTSPYARAVKATIKHRGRIPLNQFFNAKRQIREVLRHITVRPLNEDEAKTVVINPDRPYDQFAIVLSYDGHNPAEVMALQSIIRTQLGLKDIQATPDENPLAATFIVSKSKIEDALVSLKPDRTFFDEHPAKIPASLPMAITADGSAWNLPIHHTFIYGITGSGKSGPLYATIIQSAKFVEQGRVKLYGIDPKATDLRLFQQSSLFEAIAIETDEAIDIINDFYRRMNQRTRSVKIDLQAGITGQNFKATKETPWNYLIIDELFALRANLQTSKAGKEAWTQIEKIAALGRSAGFYIIAASQFADMNNLENLRQNLVNYVVLSQPNEYMNGLLLGKDAAGNGYDSTKIPASNAQNGYKYSGIGFVRKEDNTIAKVRFAYLSTEDLIAFITEHPRIEPKLPATVFDTQATEEPDDHEDEAPSWNFGDTDDEPLPDIDF